MIATRKEIKMADYIISFTFLYLLNTLDNCNSLDMLYWLFEK